MKKTIAVLAVAAVILISFSGFSGVAHELTPTEEFFVNDFANVIPDDIEAEILEAGRALEKETTAQVVIVTVDAIGEGNEVFEYSLSLARDWGIGTAETSNGCLIFLSINDKKSYIQVGYGLEGCLTDGKTGELQDKFLVPYMANKEYGTGALNIYNAILEEVYKEYSISPPEGVKAEKRPVDTATNVTLTIIYLFIALLFGGIIYMGIQAARGKYGPLDDVKDDDDYRSSRRSGGGGGGSRGGGGGFGGGGSGRSW